MARIRTIKPEFWEHEGVAALPMGARLLFVASWNFADDEGLLRWNAVWLASRAFPYDLDAGLLTVADVQGWMDQLAAANLVLPYQGANRQRYGWIVSFRKHQKINRPSPTRLPVPSIQNVNVKIAYGERDGFLCGLCQQEILPNGRHESVRHSLDHVIPRSQGGTDAPSNLRSVHVGCNKARGDHDDLRGGYDPFKVDVVPDAERPPARTRRSNVVSFSEHAVNGSLAEREREGEGEREVEVPASQGPREAVQPPLLAAVDIPSPSAPARQDPRGSRLAEEWQPTPATMAWSREWAAGHPGLNVTEEWAKFRDYWLSIPGAKGRKVDWDRTWRNWLRTAAERIPRWKQQADGPAPLTNAQKRRKEGLSLLAQLQAREAAERSTASNRRAIEA